MEDLLKSGLYGVVFLIMLVIASLKLNNQTLSKNNKLTEKVDRDKKIEEKFPNKDKIDIPLRPD